MSPKINITSSFEHNFLKVIESINQIGTAASIVMQRFIRRLINDGRTMLQADLKEGLREFSQKQCVMERAPVGDGGRVVTAHHLPTPTITSKARFRLNSRAVSFRRRCLNVGAVRWVGLTVSGGSISTMKTNALVIFSCFQYLI